MVGGPYFLPMFDDGLVGALIIVAKVFSGASVDVLVVVPAFSRVMLDPFQCGYSIKSHVRVAFLQFVSGEYVAEISSYSSSCALHFKF